MNKENSNIEEKELENEELEAQDIKEAAECSEASELETPEAEEPCEEEDEEANPLEEELKSLQDELDGIKDKLLRTVAEYDNYRKRTDREKRESASFGAAGAIGKLLPAVDALERAAEVECSDAKYKKGIMMTLQIFKKALADAGVEEIEALGADFDPTKHSAVASDEPDEEHPSGTVSRVLQKGYSLGERILRPAMVAVAS